MNLDRAIILMVIAVLLCALFAPCQGRDLGQWEDSTIKEWYFNLRQPDNPTASCCGEADAYWCDDVHVRADKTFCTITDDRDHVKLRRAPIANGTEIEIPKHKLKWDRGNPTGHFIVFLSANHYVFCFVQGSGT